MATIFDLQNWMTYLQCSHLMFDFDAPTTLSDFFVELNCHFQSYEEIERIRHLFINFLTQIGLNLEQLVPQRLDRN